MSEHAPPPTSCPNCGAGLATDPAPAHCPQCGQETRLHPPTLWEFVHEFIGHYVALEGALWRTLHALLLRPGLLTVEYLAGRRRLYVLPLRLYLSASFLFFICARLLSAGHPLDMQVQVLPSAVPAASAPDRVASAPVPSLARASAPDTDTDTLSQRIKANSARLASQPGALQGQMLAKAPWAVFLLLPLHAGLVQLAYRNRRQTYGVHFVFSLHLHAFWFIALLAMALLPEAAGPLLLLAVFGHSLLGQQRVFGGRWWATLLRGSLIAGIHLLLLVLAAAALLFSALLAA